MSKEEQDNAILSNIGLIYKCIKDLNLYWRCEDEFQDYYSAGLVGLISGVKTYSNTNIKIGTYYYKCIKNEILHEITNKNRIKRKAPSEVLSLDEDYLERVLYYDIIDNQELNIEDKLILDEDCAKLKNIISSLKKDKDRQIISDYYGLFDKDKLKSETMCNKYGVTRQAITSRVRRIKSKIKEEYFKEEE